MKSRLIQSAGVLLLCCGCHTVTISDGWRHLGATPSTTALSVRGDYVIIQKSSHQFVLIYRPEGKFIELGTFDTVEQAKGAAQQHESK